MAVSTRFATTASATGWTTPANANADDGAYATYLIGISPIETVGDVNTLSNFGFDGDIPAGAPINSVTLEVEHKVSTAAGLAQLQSALAISGVAGTYNADATEPLTDTIVVYSSMARPGGGSWTRADLLDGVFTVLLRAYDGVGGTAAVTYSWDYAKVSVDYTGVTTHATTGALVGQGSAVSGSAVHNVPHATTGALVGQGSVLSSSARRFRAFAATGALVGQGSAVAGSATHSPVTRGTGPVAAQTYILNGVTDFAFPFQVRSASQLTVELVPGDVVSPGDYTILGTGPTATGVTVRFPNAPVSLTTQLKITRYTQPDRVSVLGAPSDLTVANLNAEFNNAYDAIADLQALLLGGARIWATNTLYKVSDIVSYDGSRYLCAIEHTSGVFATDLAAGMWTIFADNILRQDLLLTGPAKGADLVAFKNIYIATLATTLDARMRSGFVSALGDRICVADNTTDAAANLNAFLVEYSAGRGGVLMFDPAPSSGGFYRLNSPIIARSNVTLQGHGPTTRLHGLGASPNAGVIWFGGLTVANLVDLTYHGLSDIAYGASTATCTVIANSTLYSVGQVVMVRTAALDVSSFPKIMIFNRILAINTGTGVITFENPFVEAMTGPQISNTTGGDYFGRASTMVQNVGVYDMALYANDPTEGKALNVLGLYEGVMENITILKSRFIINGNALSRSVARNIKGVFSAGVSECAMGSHDSLFENIWASHDGGTSNRGFLVNMTENSRRCTKKGYRIHAPNFQSSVTSGSMLTLGPAVGHRMDDWEVYTRWHTLANALIGTNARDVLVDDFEMSNMRMYGTGMQRFIAFAVANTGFQVTNWRMKNCSFYGTPSDAAIAITAGTPSFELENVFFENGSLRQASADGASKGKITNCTIASWEQTAKQWHGMKKVGNIRRGSELVYGQDKHESAIGVVQITLNPAVVIYAIPAGQTLQAFDRIILKANCRIIGTGSNAKNMTVNDGTNDLINISTTAASTGFTVEVEAHVTAVTQLATTGIFTLSGAAPVVTKKLLTVPNITTNGYTMSLRAWLGLATDAYVIDDLSWKYVPYGE